MSKKENFRLFLVKTIKALVVLFTLSAIGWFIGALPFAQDLPFMDKRLPVGAFLGAVISVLMLAAVFVYGSESGPAVDALFEFLPGAGRLFGNLVMTGAFVFAYNAFQAAVFPFIPDYEWAYQASFLGVILFFVARAGLIVHGASENVSRAIMGALHPYKQKDEPQPAAPELTEEPPRS